MSLKFKLHPLENEWLKIIDNSKHQMNVQGSMVPSVTSEDLFKIAKNWGYTIEEIGEVLQLLKTRKYIDQRQNFIVRTVDSVIDLKEAVSLLLDQIEADIVALRDALPDFEDSKYPLVKVRAELAAAKERDEIEQIRSNLRGWSGSINSFVGARTSSLRQKITDEQNKIHELNRQGIPLWLNYAFDTNPLLTHLEKQRSNRVMAYQNTLDEMRRTREASLRSLQDISGSSVTVLTKLYDLLKDLTDKNIRLTRKIEGMRDEQQDMVAWREVGKLAASVDGRAKSISQTYNYTEFVLLSEQLWKTIQDEFDADPLSIFSKHQSARDRIQQVEKRISDWVDNRRKDFEQKCQSYQLVLNHANIQLDLRVPFDPEHPSASVDALILQVCTGLQRFLNVLANSINQASTTIKYSIKVQKLPLEAVERQAHQAIQIVDQLQKVLNVEMLKDFDTFRDRIVQLLVKLSKEEQALKTEVQNAIQKRTPEGSELRLLQLLTSSNRSQRVDLRGLIIEMLESGNDAVDLNDLMKDITSLFKKNQISVYLTSQENLEETDS